jgi:hypothetical protein
VATSALCGGEEDDVAVQSLRILHPLRYGAGGRSETPGRVREAKKFSFNEGLNDQTFIGAE